MTKMLKAVRFSNSSNRREIQISVPDVAYESLKEFDIDIVDHEFTVKQSSIYLIKDGKDIYSITFNPNDKNAYANALKALLEQLKEESE